MHTDQMDPTAQATRTTGQQQQTAPTPRAQTKAHQKKHIEPNFGAFSPLRDDQAVDQQKKQDDSTYALIPLCKDLTNAPTNREDQLQTGQEKQTMPGPQAQVQPKKQIDSSYANIQMCVDQTSAPTHREDLQPVIDNAPATQQQKDATLAATSKKIPAISEYYQQIVPTLKQGEST